MSKAQEDARPTHGQLYVMRGDGPGDWVNSDIAGPFSSREAAERHVRKDVEGSCGMLELLELGENRDWADKYHILEWVHGIDPVVDVKVKVRLERLGG
jgi:hypothetical protein